MSKYEQRAREIVECDPQLSNKDLVSEISLALETLEREVIAEVIPVLEVYGQDANYEPGRLFSLARTKGKQARALLANLRERGGLDG